MNPFTYIFGAVGLVMLLVIGIQTYRLTNSERLLAQAQVLSTRLSDNNNTLTLNQKTCQAALDSQNSKFEAAAIAAKAESDRLTKAAELADSQRRGATTKALQSVSSLRMQLAEASAVIPTVTACTAALEDGRKVDQ